MKSVYQNILMSVLATLTLVACSASDQGGRNFLAGKNQDATEDDSAMVPNSVAGGLFLFECVYDEDQISDEAAQIDCGLIEAETKKPVAINNYFSDAQVIPSAAGGFESNVERNSSDFDLQWSVNITRTTSVMPMDEALTALMVEFSGVMKSGLTGDAANFAGKPQKTSTEPKKLVELDIDLAKDICEGKLNETSFHKGSGSMFDPYIVCSSQQLNSISNLEETNGTFIYLGRDIAVTDRLETIESFNGFFHGKGYKISNLRKPLFNNLENAVVKNLKITNSSIDSPNSNQTYSGILANVAKNRSRIVNVSISDSGIMMNSQNLGALVGVLQNSKIKAVKAEQVNVESLDAGLSAGVLVGTCIESRITDLTIRASGVTGQQNVGGFCGELSASIATSPLMAEAIEVAANNSGIQSENLGIAFGSIVEKSAVGDIEIRNAQMDGDKAKENVYGAKDNESTLGNVVFAGETN